MISTKMNNKQLENLFRYIKFPSFMKNEYYWDSIVLKIFWYLICFMQSYKTIINFYYENKTIDCVEFSINDFRNTKFYFYCNDLFQNIYENNKSKYNRFLNNGCSIYKLNNCEFYEYIELKKNIEKGNNFECLFGISSFIQHLTNMKIILDSKEYLHQRTCSVCLLRLFLSYKIKNELMIDILHSKNIEKIDNAFQTIVNDWLGISINDFDDEYNNVSDIITQPLKI
jgi:hypothetical protein